MDILLQWNDSIFIFGQKRLNLDLIGYTMKIASFVFLIVTLGAKSFFGVFEHFKVHMKMLVEMKSAGSNRSNYTEQFAICPSDIRLVRCMIPYRTCL